EKSTKNQQNGNVNIKGKRVALEAEVEQRDTDVKGKRIALETEINQRDEDIKGKLTALDAENQKLRDKVIEIEQQYNKYQELTTLYCKFPNNQIPENVKIVIKKCKLDKILDTLEKNNNDLADRLQYLVSNIQVLQNKAKSSESCLSLVESLSNQVTELEAENTMLRKEKVKWMSYSDYLDQEKDSFNGNIANEFYKVLVDRRIEINILQEEMINIKKQIINKELMVSENENK
ncbi:19270_t:CDS:2, partial [Gigaspora rosea]